MNHAWKAWLIVGAVLALVVGVVLKGPIAQYADYHEFADARTIWGVPSFWNVVSNVPFAIVGVWGLVATWRMGLVGRAGVVPSGLLTRTERWCWSVFFVGVFLTCFGSSYYHLAPDDHRLVWDRIPIAIAFMGLTCAIVAERVSARVAGWMLAPLTIAAAASVFHWYHTQMAGASDLRSSVLVQGGAMIVVIGCAALYRPRHVRNWVIMASVAAYALAKVFEMNDGATMKLLAIGSEGVMSGHTLKHLLAAVGPACVAFALAKMVKAKNDQVVK
jgi:predicted membrane channel-forming protein YqfA (hemolysin III family)